MDKAGEMVGLGDDCIRWLSLIACYWVNFVKPSSMERPFATTGKMLLLLDYCNHLWVNRGGQEWGRESGE